MRNWAAHAIFISLIASSANAQMKGLFPFQNACNSYQGLLKTYGITTNWRLADNGSTTATDRFAAISGTYYNAPTQSLDGPLLKPSQAVMFDGSTQVVYANTQIAAPSIFTELVWFKTTTQSGGKIIGFGDQQTSLSSSYDRHLYMNNSGTITFGVYNSGTVVLTSTSTYNDGNWHMAVGTMGASGMSLSVDGGTPLTNSNTTGASYNGYWKVGGDNLNGWNNQPSSHYFAGTISEVAVSKTKVLTSAQIVNLYQQGSRCSNYTAPPATLYLSSAQSQYNGGCSAAVNITTNTPPASTLTVNLSGTGLTFYSDSNCLNAITSTSIAASASTGTSFYFMGGTNGSLSLTASATNYVSANQTETISTSPYLWTGAGANAKWSTAANWYGGAVPGSSNVALFNSTCSSNCSPTIDSSISVGGIRMASTYTGTITQGSGNAITLNSGGWVMSAGTFAGATSGDITMGSNLAIVGGTFTSTSGTLSIGVGSNPSELITSASAVFNHHSGTLSFYNSVGDYQTWNYSNTLGAALNLYNLDFSGQAAHAGWLNHGFNSQTVNVANNLTFSSSNSTIAITVGSITINVAGNISCPSGGAGGTATVVVNGNTAQTYSGSSGAYIPNLTVNTTGSFAPSASGDFGIQSLNLQKGTFTAPSGGLYFGGSGSASLVTIASGTTFSHNNGSVVFNFSVGDWVSTNYTISTPSAWNLNNVYFNGSCPHGCWSYYTINQPINVAGNLTFNPYSMDHVINSGTINLTGNLNISAGDDAGSSSVLNFVGNSGQTVSNTGWAFPFNTVNVAQGASGTVSLLSALTANSSSWTVTGGSIYMNGYNLSLSGLSLGGSTIHRMQGTGSSDGTLTANGTSYVNGSYLGGTVAD